VSDPPPDVAFARRAAYLQAADALVVADVHLGRDRGSDVQLPLGGPADARERLAAALDRFDPAEVVVAGDLLHSFGHLPDGVADAVDAFAGAVADAGAGLVVTPGNHDAMLAAAFDGPTPDAHRLADGTVVCHGHERPDVRADRYVFGHDHPAITIEGQRHPCFLHGEGVVDGGEVLVLPAFSRLARGVDVGDRWDPLSPSLVGAAGDCRPVVYDEGSGEALSFPPLSRLWDHL
jgi:putative SbcD/Mre11-related phosphoesterase